MTAGSAVGYRIRVSNHGNAPTSGWTLQLHNVAAVPLYDGSGQLGSFMAEIAVPDGLQPGASVDLEINANAPAGAGSWLVKADVRLSGGDYASTSGVAPLQVGLTTVAP